MNMIAGIFITIALFFYTFGVIAEKRNGQLNFRHLLLFICGFICDTLGTGIMFEVSEGFSINFHSISGLLAIILMFLHVVWAVFVLIRKEDKMISNFHKFSFFVWMIWLVPYFSPFFSRLV